MDAGEILKLVEFKTDYYNLIETKFNKIAESLGERLIDGENVLLEKYSKAASQKLKGWIENITKSELERFRRRDKELNRDENDKLISPGFINLLQLIKVQLEPITFNKNVFLYIAKTVYDYCNEFKENICEAIEADFVPTCKNKSMPGYEDYCIMFGNSGLKLTQYITSLPQCQSDEIRELGNVFIGILKFANHFLSEFVIFTCNPAFKKIFTSSWNESFKVFLVTIDDFLTDYSVVMSDFTFNTFCNELCSCITSAYFKRLNEKNVVIDVNSGENIRNDYNRLLKVFDKFLPSENLEVELSPLIKLIPLFTVNDPDMISLELKSLIMSTENIDIKMIENIITQRSNLYEKTKLKMIEKLRVIYEQTANQKKKLFN